MMAMGSFINTFTVKAIALSKIVDSRKIRHKKTSNKTANNGNTFYYWILSPLENQV